MPAPLLSKEAVLDRLLATFREQGYDGASLAELSEATGLGKSSLYHHFPGGKKDMALQVMDHLAAQLEVALFAPLRSNRSPESKLDAMLTAINDFYDGGKSACLLERLCASVDRKEFKKPLARAFETWMDAVEALLREAGVSPALARARAEDLVVRVEGALIVCAGTGNTEVFKRTMADLRAIANAPRKVTG